MMEKNLAIVVTLDGLYGFIGVPVVDKADKTGRFFILENGLTIGYHEDGTPYPTFGQLPVGIFNPAKPMRTLIPVRNISYIVEVSAGDDHPFVKTYNDFFAGLAQPEA